MKLSVLIALFLSLAVSGAIGQQWPWQQPTTTTTRWTPNWWNWFTTTTRRPIFFSSTTQRPIVPSSSTPFLPTMQTGVQKTTTPGGPRPVNDNFVIPCGYSAYTEQEGTSSLVNQGIVGGTEARVNEFPYQVRINYNGGFICGGSIISNRHILTAAHCILDTNPASFSVVLGDHNRNTMDSNEKTYRIERVTKHPGYSSSNQQNDMAVLVVSGAIALDRKSARTICLPPNDGTNLVGQNAIITGWGKLTEGGATATVLQKASVPVITNDECQRSYGTSAISSDMLCAGFKSGGVDSCQGDSGGPMMVLINGRFYLHGVTSWGVGCARSGYPGVYARVTANLDWIVKQMQ